MRKSMRFALCAGMVVGASLLWWWPEAGNDAPADVATTDGSAVSALQNRDRLLGPEGRDLNATFPWVAQSILSGPNSLPAVRGDGGILGFARPLGSDEDVVSFLSAMLPAAGEEPVEFMSGTPYRVRVQPSGTRGPGRSLGTAVVYDAEHGASFWSATEDGYEEWLWVDEPTDGVVASYAIDGAVPELHEERVVLVNDDGVAVLDMEAPEAWTADGRSVDVWLEVRGGAVELSVDVPDDVDGPILVDPVWTRVDDLPLGRMLHTATRLLDGRVLVTGGISESGTTVLDQVDIFDPRTNSWSPGAPLPIPMRSHMQALLADGRVFITRGGSAFIYDPESDSWLTPDPSRNLVGGPGSSPPQHSALLPTGQLMLTGGYGLLGKTSWLYDPDTDQFHPLPDMNEYRQQHTMVLMGDGTVLAAGGGTNNSSSLMSNTAELYVPDFTTSEPYLNGSWQVLPNMSSGHFDHGTALLITGPNAGKALICSGLDGATQPGSYLWNTDCELYDPVTQTFTLADPVPAARQRSGTGNGGDYMVATDAGEQAGTVVIAGGYPVTWRSETYDPEVDAWTEGCWLNEARLRHTTTPLLDGSVLAVGGQFWPYAPFDGRLRSVERLNLGMDDDDCDGIPNEQDICEDNPTDRPYNPVGRWCGNVSGRVYFDDDEDCVDGGEPGAAGVMVRADSGSEQRYAITDFDGVFELDLPAGQWDVTMVDRSYLDPVAACGGAAKSYSISAATGPVDLDFGLKPGCEGTVAITSGDPGTGTNALCNGLPYTSPCPQNEWMYNISVSNQGSPWVPGASPGSTVTVTLPEGMTYQSATYGSCVNALTVIPGSAPAPIQDVLIFDLSQIGTGSACSISVITTVDSFPAGGWEATADLEAQCAGDTLVDSAGVVESFECGCDPNDKGVYPPGCDVDGILETPEPLDYRIRFQNMGLGPAHDVVVTDQIDPDLELESLRFTYTSHPFSSVQIDPNGLVVVRYDGIELPAAVDDPDGSQGGFVFRSEPLTVADGTVYNNVADIFFDSNEVVVTNEVVNTIGVCPDYPPGHDPNGPSRSGVADGTNPGQGLGLGNNPTNGANSNPNQAP